MAEPVLVYDDDCGFCTWWAEYFDARTDLEIVGFSAMDEDLPARLPETYENCSHLVTDEAVYSCGKSIEEAALRTGFGRYARRAVGVLRRVDAYERLREWSYRHVAGNRSFWGRLLSRATDGDGTRKRA